MLLKQLLTSFFGQNGTQSFDTKRKEVYEKRNELLQKFCKQYNMTHSGNISETLLDKNLLFHPEYQVTKITFT